MNAEEVARLLGISDKTVRRHLKKGTIKATRKASGELKISDDQIEKLRLVLELEDKPGHVQPAAAIGRLEQADMSRQVEKDIEQRLAALAQSIANLNATIASQTRRIDELSRRVAELETASQSPSPPLPLPTTTAIPHPQKSTGEPSDAMLSARDFAQQIGMDYTALDGYIRRGVRGERMDVTEVPTKRKGYVHKYFSKEQQKKALELLRKHGKL